MRAWAGITELTVFLVAVAVTGGARPGGQANSKPPGTDAGAQDISGYWELSFDGRKVPPAELAAGVTKQLVEQHHEADEHAIRWCNLLGMPFLMDSGRPVDIREGTREVVINAEINASPRHIYLDRAQHIGLDVFDTTSNGDSIAHWEGDTLVVDTTGFDGKKGLTQIPGGGYRTNDSHLVERYRLLENGSVLSVVFTWSDAKVFRSPHMYEFRYTRLPQQYEPIPAARCDPYDDVRTKFLEGAPVKTSSAGAR